jgi:uncharacterized OsmC-like protein
VVEGVHCEAEDGRWTIAADASEKSGGTAKGPDPGFIVRASLGTCLAMGYVTWAAHLGVPISNLEIEVQADFDVRGQHDTPGISPGYSEIRYLVHIESDASAADIERMVETADRASMVADVFRRPHQLVRQLTVTRPAG